MKIKSHQKWNRKIQNSIKINLKLESILRLKSKYQDGYNDEMSRTGVDDDRCYQSRDNMDLEMDDWLWSAGWPESRPMTSVNRGGVS